MNDAERIAELEAEVAYLRGELGLSLDSGRLASLRQALGLEPREAMLLLALHQAGGRILSSWQLLDAIPPVSRTDDEPGLIKVWICRLRRKLGRAVVETVWGAGYRLSTTGHALVLGALEERARAA